MNASQEPSDDWIVEVSAEIADRAEEILREFATDAELDLALIVDIGGGLVAGVATRPDVHVDTIGALVAGAFGAMRVLAGELGESKLVESVHHGARDVIHLRDIDGQFILLGLTERALPAGLIREKAAQISARLAVLLAGATVPAGTTDGEEETGETRGGAPEPRAASPFEKVREETERNAAAAAEEAAEPEGAAPEAETTQPQDQGAPAPQGVEKEGERTTRPKGGKYIFEIR